MMNGYDIQRWKRSEKLAVLLDVDIEIYEGFRLRDIDGLSLGTFGTIDEVYAFLCGYEYSCKPNIRDEPLPKQQQEND